MEANYRNLFSNVFALESVLKTHPSAGEGKSYDWCISELTRIFTGVFLTFAQFLYVACQTLSTQLTFNKKGGAITQWIPQFKGRVVPLKRWAMQTVLFLAVSLLNNLAFGFKVSRKNGYCYGLS